MSAYRGLKVLDCSQGRAGPMAGMLLADFGADVLKVEPPGGDAFAEKPGYQTWNRGKQRATLDLDTAAGREQLEALLAAVDVAIFDFGPKRMAALGLADAADRHPRLVQLWTPPYGTTGDWSDMPAHHGALMALSGACFRQSSYQYQPMYMVMPFLHYMQATMAAGAAGAALYERTRSGRGQSLSVSGFNAVSLVGGAAGYMPIVTRRPLGASPSYRAYRCGDGRYLLLATLFSYFFKRATDVMGLTVALAEDVFPDHVTQLMEQRFLDKPRAEWLELFRAADAPAGPVNPREEWLRSELIANNDMRLVFDHPVRGPVEMPGTPLKLSKTPAAVRGLVRDAAPSEVAAFAAPAPKPADATASPSPAAAPLAGVRVLDLGTVIAGAYAGAILANLGAEVIKVESAEGDPWRDRGVGFTAYNRGKRGLVVDLKQPDGRELFLDLVRACDVVIDNYRFGVRDRLGITHAELLAANPRIVSASATAYGARGDEVRRPGFDPLLQACSGMMQAQGGDGQEPVFHTVAVNDFGTACMMAQSVIAALNARDVTGEGQSIDTSLAAQSAIFQSGEITTWPGAELAPTGDRDCLGVAALDRFYACADGWILLAPAGADEAAAAAAALGRPDWTDRFDLLKAPRDGELAREIAAALAARPRAEALAALTAAGVRCAPAIEVDDVPADAYLRANDFVDTELPTPFGPVLRRPFGGFSRTPVGYTRPDPGLGEHSFEVLADWGIAADRIAQLGDDGVVMVLC